MNEVTSYKDIVNNSLLNVQPGALTVSDVVTSLLMTLVISMLIFWLYKKSFRGVLYTHSFNISLVMISLVTSLVIMTISTNLILSLGMVGALSIVRFRTAVKDPLDIVFMFWAIAVGIANGAMQFQLSLVGSIFIASVILVLSRIKTLNNPYLLVLHYQANNESDILDQISSIITSYKIKSKTVSSGTVELTLEIRVKKNNIDFVDEVSKIENLKDLGLVSYEGDYVS
jgi:uncharacterized membrane protein YhiD involved in acid resistance